MIRPEEAPQGRIAPHQIPDAVWLAMRDYLREHPYGWDYKESIAAALNAWPGTKACEEDDLGPASIILPLPEAERIAKQEESDNG